MTLDEAIKLVESRFIVGPAGNYSEAPTGEPYVTIVGGGIKEEGELFPCYFLSEAFAIQFWLDAVNKYSEGKSGTLYWRVKPEMMGRKKVWLIYSRLLISDKPQIQSAILESLAS